MWKVEGGRWISPLPLMLKVHDSELINPPLIPQLIQIIKLHLYLCQAIFYVLPGQSSQ